MNHAQVLRTCSVRSEGTVRLKAISPGTEFVAVGSTVFFAGGDINHGPELWKTDGTPESTVLVKDIHPGPFTGSKPLNLIAFKQELPRGGGER